MFEDEDAKFDRITVDPDVMGGQPYVRGLRVPLALIGRLVANGRIFTEIVGDYP